MISFLRYKEEDSPRVLNGFVSAGKKRKDQQEDEISARYCPWMQKSHWTS